MLTFYMMIFLTMFFMGGLGFIFNRKHLLSMLLSLEYMVLSLFCLMVMYLLFFGYQLFFNMMFLTFSVCEGALGLSILVSLIRTHGNDYFQSFNILQC
uniref:NADH-ubiquinone oxidoreductase chain 4L n=1 Tax=Argyra pingwuensis TaxID=2762466 RepID=A0A7G6KSC9_9MUSC|nr:NADH dehydrogenase subunit 4L [Argyra pingwuensis]QNC71311.1 NADH dehydrogenase subunit 4L [Argyra pingwuensis]